MNEAERPIMSILGEAVEYGSPEERAAFLETLTAQGFCGAKTNRGFYTYPGPAYAQADFLQRQS